MPVMVNVPPKLADAFLKASAKANKRTQKLQSKSNEICSRCKNSVPNNNLWSSKGRYYCVYCKTPKATKAYVLSGFSFKEVFGNL